MALKAVVTFETETNDDADNVTNTFAIGGAFGEADVDATVEAALNQAFQDFYSALSAGQTNELADILSPVIVTGLEVVRLDLYDVSAHLDGSPHGSPFSSTLFDLAMSTSPNPLPSEVAVCVTLEGTGRAAAQVEVPDDGDPGIAINRPKQRRTGRIYFGPLGDLITTTVAGVCRPAGVYLADLRASMLGLNADITAASPTGNAHLAVWSRADGAMYELEAVSTDDAFDTQRRRGEQPTARTRQLVP